MRSALLLQLCNAKLDLAKSRGSVQPQPRKGRYANFMDDRSGMQLYVSQHATGEVRVQVLRRSSIGSTMYWAESTRQGLMRSGEKQAREIPAVVVESLANSLPLPAPGVYAYRRDGRVVALYHTAQSANDPTHFNNPFVLAGEQEPSLHVAAGSGRLTITSGERWWRAVDEGRITSALSELYGSKQVLLGRWRGFSWYMLLQDEQWTGVEGLALYACPLIKGNITPALALKRGGEDIRTNFRARR